MKIAILTFSFAINRGAHMQCYALQTVLRNMGHQVEIIHIELPSNGLSWKGKIDRFLLNFQNKRFRRRFYSKITRVYCSADELRKYPPVADVFVVGSDQVWNTSITRRFGSEAFFLDFAPDRCRKIAYAASFGNSAWVSLGKAKDEEIRSLVQQFSGISVRELDGIEICHQIFGRKDTVSVIDPVFLLDDYTSLIGTSKKENNEAICYPLYTNSETRGVFLQISRDLHLKPISYSRSICGENIKVRLFSSIPQWLKAISESHFIVTNSFHCMAFCILFHKKFVVTPPVPGRESRMLSMLRQLGMENRYVTSITDFQNRKKILYAEIDYKEVEKKLQILRRESLNFLLNNL